MSLKQKGFTLLETLIALALSSAVLLGAGKLFPALQRGVLMQYQKEMLQESLWQLAFSLGKNLRRAGYCNGQCAGNGLTLGNEGKCVIIRWDFNSNGVWEPAGHAEAEMTGFRLREGSLETLKGAVHCDGGNWQRISDPNSMAIKYFVVRRLARQGLPPLLEIEISALPKRGSQMITLRHSVVGYNL
ncbi:prepilin peptidase-dependent protein [Dryocola clanedunensis]|uniref:prepilin peptidase-dependent protein n=1 Tax=Cedecea sulfonylureivorans TaxID=3051154 RepID=UPI0019261A56|nr:prepilin peptidase-dependent protein [Cedecea sulfonylureivorans]